MVVYRSHHRWRCCHRGRFHNKDPYISRRDRPAYWNNLHLLRSQALLQELLEKEDILLNFHSIHELKKQSKIEYIVRILTERTLDVSISSITNWTGALRSVVDNSTFCTWSAIARIFAFFVDAG